MTHFDDSSWWLIIYLVIEWLLELILMIQALNFDDSDDFFGFVH